MKVIIDDKIPFIKGVLEPFANVVYLPGGRINASDVKEADALITRTRTRCNQNLLGSSKVKIIATATIGYDHIDTEYCDRAGIKWVNAPGCNSGSVMQYIASSLVTLRRRKNIPLKDKTLGIIGVGNVGSKIIRIAEAFEMKVLLNDPPRERKEGTGKFVDLNYLLKHSDIISIHVPLIKEGQDKTFHLFDANNLSKLKSSSILINSSRGEVIDTNALIEAIRKKQISSVVLDVWEHEPEINVELLKLVDIATPHIAGYSQDGKANGTAMAVQAISDFFSLGLKNWFPSNLPKPEEPCITIPNLTDIEESLSLAVFHTYNINKDDERLRSDVGSFEQQRGNYPVRREFNAYHIQNKPQLLANKLAVLGFDFSKSA